MEETDSKVITINEHDYTIKREQNDDEETLSVPSDSGQADNEKETAHTPAQSEPSFNLEQTAVKETQGTAQASPSTVTVGPAAETSKATPATRSQSGISRKKQRDISVPEAQPRKRSKGPVLIRPKGQVFPLATPTGSRQLIAPGKPPALPQHIASSLKLNSSDVKGVLVLQDVKVCTMYTPKNSGGGQTAAVANKIIHHLQTSAAAPKNLLEVPTRNPINNVPPPPPHVRNRTVVNQVYALICSVQKILAENLPMNWFSAAEKDGVNAMCLSFNKEKAIQRRIYLSVNGAVEISIHCRALTDEMKGDFVKKTGDPPTLTLPNVQEFADWIVKMVLVIRDLEICCGVDRPDLKKAWDSDGEGYHDTNPYQECRYSETYRAKTCTMLVELGKRRCLECQKLFGIVKKKATTLEQDGYKKRAPNYTLTEEQKIAKLKDLQSKLTQVTTNIRRREKRRENKEREQDMQDASSSD